MSGLVPMASFTKSIVKEKVFDSGPKQVDTTYYFYEVFLRLIFVDVY